MPCVSTAQRRSAASTSACAAASAVGWPSAATHASAGVVVSQNPSVPRISTCLPLALALLLLLLSPAPAALLALALAAAALAVPLSAGRAGNSMLTMSGVWVRPQGTESAAQSREESTRQRGSRLGAPRGPTLHRTLAPP